jgi:RNA polymerase sigma-70 factor, ECF subfamily
MSENNSEVVKTNGNLHDDAVSNEMRSPADFEAVLRTNGSQIYTLAIRLTGNQSDGQDLAQETFLKAFKHWNRFRGDSETGTWLYRICVNCWKNRVRYEKRRSFWKHFSLDRQGADDEEAAPRELASLEVPLHQSLEQAQDQARLLQALARLEPQERAIVFLRDIEGRRYEEISETLELPLGTVKSRLARSRERLRELLEKDLKELP